MVKETERGEEEKHRFLRFHAIFNVEQVSGLSERFTRLAPPLHLNEALSQSESFIAALGADIRHGGNIAAYAPALDCILLPHRERFESDARYLATQLHEHRHWTGHKSRIARDFTGRFGDNAYAAEELVAEVTAAGKATEAASYMHAIARPEQLVDAESMG